MGDLENGWKRLFCVSTRLDLTLLPVSSVDLRACAVDAVRFVVRGSVECHRRAAVGGEALMRRRGIVRLGVAERKCARQRWHVYLDDMADAVV